MKVKEAAITALVTALILLAIISGAKEIQERRKDAEREKASELFWGD